MATTHMPSQALQGDLNALNSNMGDLASLHPDTKTSLVNAINDTWDKNPYRGRVLAGNKTTITLAATVSPQWFLIIGSLSNTVRIAYLAVKYSGSWYLSNLGGDGTMSVANSTVTFSTTYADVMIFSNAPFTAS